MKVSEVKDPVNTVPFCEIEVGEPFRFVDGSEVCIVVRLCSNPNNIAACGLETGWVSHHSPEATCQRLREYSFVFKK